jgi:hypothetical protein
MSPIGGRRAPRFATRACELCGEPFAPTNGRQRYCCEQHRRWHPAGVPGVRECRHCGATFAPRHAHERYCTREHQRVHFLKRRRDAKRAATVAWQQRVRDLERAIATARARLDREGAAP